MVDILQEVYEVLEVGEIENHTGYETEAQVQTVYEEVEDEFLEQLRQHDIVVESE